MVLGWDPCTHPCTCRQPAGDAWPLPLAGHPRLALGHRKGGVPLPRTQPTAPDSTGHRAQARAHLPSGRRGVILGYKHAGWTENSPNPVRRSQNARGWTENGPYFPQNGRFLRMAGERCPVKSGMTEESSGEELYNAAISSSVSPVA